MTKLYSLWAWCLKQTSPTVTTAYNTVQPLAATVLGVVFLSEPFKIIEIFGGIVIALGLLCVIWGRAREKRQQETNMEETDNAHAFVPVQNSDQLNLVVPKVA